jgi:molybdopterin-guanine dinucleotide biosynthesis protein A
MRRRLDPIGVILAGGQGRRIGGSKAIVELCGRPLISYPLAALRASIGDVAVIAKADTELPSMPGVTVWIEPELPRHPLVGIVQGLALAAERPVLACGVDLPFVTPELIARIAGTDPLGAPAVVPRSEGGLQPLPALYLPAALNLLGRSARIGNAPLRELVAAIGPRLVDVDDRDAFFNVNVPEELLQAAAMIDRRAQR